MRKERKGRKKESEKKRNEEEEVTVWRRAGDTKNLFCFVQARVPAHPDTQGRYFPYTNLGQSWLPRFGYKSCFQLRTKDLGGTLKLERKQQFLQQKDFDFCPIDKILKILHYTLSRSVHLAL